MNTPQPLQPGSRPADPRPELTNRPQPSQDQGNDQDSLGPTPDGLEEDSSLRDLKPRPIDEQFGADPAIEPDGDQRDGAKEWVDHSPGVRENVPDDDKP